MPFHIPWHTSPGHTIYHATSARPYHIPCDARQAIPNTMPWPPGHTIYIMSCPPGHTITIPCPPYHTIYHAVSARPLNILCQTQCLACQAIFIYHAMPVRPYHIPMRCPPGHTIPCDAHKAIPYHMPGCTIIPCDACQAILYTMRGPRDHTIHHAMPIRPYHNMLARPNNIPYHAARPYHTI